MILGTGATAAVDESGDAKAEGEGAYVIGSFVVHNPKGYAPYPMAAARTMAPFGGKAIVVDTSPEILEGTPGPLTVVLRFPSKEAARAWYNSPAYREILPLRHENATGTLVIADHFVIPGAR